MLWGVQNFKNCKVTPPTIKHKRVVGPVAVLGTAGPGAEIICGALAWKFSVNQDYSSSYFR